MDDVVHSFHFRDASIRSLWGVSTKCLLYSRLKEGIGPRDS